MSDITIVTAFFDIGRKDFNILKRDNSEYFKAFECWARIQNKLVIYTQPEFEEDILNIRRKFHREDETEVIVIDDVYSIDKEIFQRYEQISQCEYFDKYKLLEGTLSAKQPKYNYVILLKFWFLMDAQKRGLVDDLVAWLDFGFGHSTFFANPEEFDYKWDYDFARKIILFTLHELDEIPMFEIVRCSLNYIMTGVMVAPKELCERCWWQVREAAMELTSIGFMDDEQTVVLLAYRNHSGDYEVIKSDWHMGLVTYGGQHLTLTKDLKKETKVESSGVTQKVHKLFKKSKENRTGIYGLLDKYRNFKMSKQKSSLEIECEKLSKDCAERTYKQVYQLYLNDRSH